MSILNLEPKEIWKNFNNLNAIPRASKKEKQITAFMKSFGDSLGLETTVDEMGNVLIRKAASVGMNERRTVILQSHLDMVCQKNSETKFDFDTDKIQTVIDNEWVRADGTTLGADNGIGVATIMAILESKSIVHPALEALFTVDEETGMTGAFGLKPGFLKGDILLNLDTEEDDEITIGCAGGIDVTASQEFSVKESIGEGVLIEIKGLRGGHSGVDIHEGRGNANVILGRLLYSGINNGIQLGMIDAGGLRNAIPREASAYMIVSDKDSFLLGLESLKASILAEYKNVEKGLEIKFSVINKKEQVIGVVESIRFIQALVAAHNGVFRMSPDVAGLVEASNNIARVSLANGKATIMCLTRSSVESTKTAIVNQLQSSFELAGMDVLFSGAYPGWKPNPDAGILTVMEQIYTRKFNNSPRVDVIHAGLECGIIGAHYPHMEMVSFGPTIKGAHSPEERVNIKSVQKFWSYLLEILKEIPLK